MMEKKNVKKKILPSLNSILRHHLRNNIVKIKKEKNIKKKKREENFFFLSKQE